ncbi:hypothetical protein OIDMADRAFT_32531 [Oidiodendron maius Zn]|uniref:F-box domain-containing protein n=1 Tax=Oidiodendron maius (strain Zn) TaxID=913774 RepID=A0A0C3H2D7_OIDMZ|nr:hypothetical protein OIDMADRAFT_32531 [Oidiodendron maius Zn]
MWGLRDSRVSTTYAARGRGELLQRLRDLEPNHAPNSNPELEGTGSVLNLFNLPHELRDSIWTLVVAEDVLTISSSAEASGLLQPRSTLQTLQTLTTFSLLLVNRQVNNEITAVFCNGAIFEFNSNATVSRLLGYQLSYSSPRLMLTPLPCPRIFEKIGHLSIVPSRRLYHNKDIHGSPVWHYEIKRATALFCSVSRPDGWRNVEAGMAQLLRGIRLRKMNLRSLEIPAALLFNVTVVRQLRLLRGVNLHFLFIIENPTIGASTSQRDSSKQRNPKWIRKWVDETGDTDLALPIYEMHYAIEPIAIAPFGSLVAAIRREAASTAPRPISVSEALMDPPLWVEFDAKHTIDTTGLSPPISGWYTYISRDPGVCCFEQTTAPTPAVPAMRKEQKRCRREMGKLKSSVRPWSRESNWERMQNIDLPRVTVIRQQGIGAIIKCRRSRGQSL